MCASFSAARWSAKVIQPVRVSPLWPASWVSAVDKTRNSKSAEVREVWELYDKCLQFLPVGDALATGDALAGRDVHLAWRAWSIAAESALACAFGMAGGPIHPNDLVLGRGAALFRVDNFGHSRVRRLRPDLDDPASASEVHLYRNCSVAPFLLSRGGCEPLRVFLGVSLGMGSRWQRHWILTISGLVLLAVVRLGF